MEDDSEHFDVFFFVEQYDDGPSRLVRSVEKYEDGTEVVTEYEEVPSAEDPYVRSRQRTAGDGPPSEIVTEFLPSPVRPPTYPAGFLFLANRACHTTESPAGVMSTGVRWPCSDPEAVLASAAEACLADGWIRIAMADVQVVRENLSDAFRRQNNVRLFHRYDHDSGSVIQMGDLGGDWLDVVRRTGCEDA